jgi:hypothetical protein
MDQILHPRCKRRYPRHIIDGRVSCLRDGGAEPMKGRVVDISSEGMGLLLIGGDPRTSQIRKGTRLHLEVFLGQEPAPARLEALVVRYNVPHELGGLLHVGVTLAEGQQTREARDRCLAYAREHHAPQGEPRLSICDMVMTYDWRDDCSKFALLVDNVALPVELKESGLSAITSREVSGDLCVYIFGSSMDISQPTLCCWARVAVGRCEPMTDMPGFYRVDFKFLSCPDHTRALVQTCFALYGMS